MFNLFSILESRFWHMEVWYSLPAIIAISLVYAATRHERMRPLLAHAGRVALWIAAFMVAVFGMLAAMDWWVSA
jgi:hypothetical protein